MKASHPQNETLPLLVAEDALQQTPVAADLSLHLHLDAHQVLVVVDLPLHLVPHLAQLRLQAQHNLVEALQLAAVASLRVLQGVLQGSDLGGERTSKWCCRGEDKLSMFMFQFVLLCKTGSRWHTRLHRGRSGVCLVWSIITGRKGMLMKLTGRQTNPQALFSFLTW